MKIKGIDELKALIKPYLTDYLTEKGIKISGVKAQCPSFAENHLNKDANLSAAFLPQSNNTQLYCFVEQRTFDIFDCYSILEKKSIAGEEFFNTIKFFADKYNIPYELDNFYSPKEIEKNRKQNLIENLHKLSLTNISNGLAYYKQRNLNKEKVKFYKIGFISPDLITKEMDDNFKSLLGYKLKSVLYCPSLVIPVFSSNMQYIGVVLRQFGGKDKDKYINCFIEEKILYNINNIKENDYIYIVEGCFDGISLFPEIKYLSIFTNAVNDTQLEYIAKKKFKKIFICLDEDNLYQGEKRDGILRTVLKFKNIDTDIEIVLFPKEIDSETNLPKKIDPDSFIKEHGLPEFKKLPLISGIEYLLENYQQQKIELKELYEFINSCPNIIKKEKYITITAAKLGLDKKQILGELDTTQDSRSQFNLVTFVQEKEYLETMLDSFTDYVWNKKFDVLKSGFPLFDKYIGGFEDTFYMLIGFPEAFKTTLLLNFIIRLLQSNVYLAFYSLDDGAKRSIIPRLLSIITEISSKQIKYPTEEIKEKWLSGMKFLQGLKKSFIVKDGADIITLADLDNFLRIHYNIAQENKKKFVIVIDNLHALTSNSRFESVENTQRIAGFMKRLPQVYTCPIIATAEVPKSASTKPTGKDIKESIDLWYAARFVGGLFTDAFQKSDSNLLWRVNESIFAPIVEMVISKNQTGDSWHGSLFYKFCPQNNRLIECTEEEMKILRDGQPLI